MATYELSSSSSSIVKEIKNCPKQKLSLAAKKNRNALFVTNLITTALNPGLHGERAQVT
jgi:hypothetical protein